MGLGRHDDSVGRPGLLETGHRDVAEFGAGARQRRERPAVVGADPIVEVVGQQGADDADLQPRHRAMPAFGTMLSGQHGMDGRAEPDAGCDRAEAVVTPGQGKAARERHRALARLEPREAVEGRRNADRAARIRTEGSVAEP